jgi:hypothetical protein
VERLKIARTAGRETCGYERTRTMREEFALAASKTLGTKNSSKLLGEFSVCNV